MVREWEDRGKVARAAGVYIRLALPPYTVHFKSPTYMKEATLELLDKRVCKETVKSTANQLNVREAIGTDAKFWSDAVLLLRAAVPSLERRSFTIWDPSNVDYESTSGALIASHYPALWKDLERLNDIVAIFRNVLTIGARAQDLAAEHRMDAEISRLINCCVRVTARGYDGEAGTGEEEKWQWIVNSYKKLLITSLQFFNNLVAQNERRKLMLWVALFDHASAGNDSTSLDQPEDVPTTSTRSLTDLPSNPLVKPVPPINALDVLVAFGTNGGETLSMVDLEAAVPVYEKSPFANYPLPDEALQGRQQLPLRLAKGEPGGNGYVLFGRVMRQFQIEDYKTEHGRDPTLAEMHLDLPRRWADLQQSDKQYWMQRCDDDLARWRQNLGMYGAKLIISQPLDKVKETHRMLSEVPPGEQAKAVERKIKELESELSGDAVADKRNPPSQSESAGNVPASKEDISVTPLQTPLYSADGMLPWTESPNFQPRPIGSDDMRMLFTAEAGSKILESGKAELMKRLEGYESTHARVDDEETHRLKMNLEIIQKGNYVRPESPTAQARQQERVEATLAEAERRGLIPARGAVPAPTIGDLAHAIEQDYAQAQTDRYHSARKEDATKDVNGIGDDVNEVDEEDEEDEEEDEEEEEDDVDEEDGEDEEDDEEEDYPGSTEDGRGLLTDVPLILGPSEIEVLPMLIMSGIVPPPLSAPGHPKDMTEEERNALTNMHTVRTHLLLSQSTGRNLLRELLIFVAAWDLREEELYFKFMVKIMEAILKNGLMPYAYHAFRDRSRSKDIISPAQAVIMKLLTCIFRARSESTKQAAAVNANRSSDAQRTMATSAYHPHAKNPIPPQGTSPFPFPLASMPSRVDLHVLNFIFTEFRQHIIPQTCALIFLQGQIHAGRASPEDFPLNLWDMERMYEGVYQYLEFFAVLSEEAVWKGILGQWEMASELVTLLRELEAGIPKMSTASVATAQQHYVATQAQEKVDAAAPGDLKPRSMSSGAAGQSYTAPATATPTDPVAVERPFDGAAPPQSQPLPPHPEPAFDLDTPLVYPEDTVGSAAAMSSQDVHSAGVAAEQDEPSDFEWRNLKKLTVLVLSSLIWKNQPVQDQVRRYGGLEALVACCRPDEHNPYIREHAIMCLRFAVEGCEENAEVIRRMAGARKMRQQQLDGGAVTLGPHNSHPLPHTVSDDGSVPREVLDTQGYETFMDPKGQVGLRKKDGQPAHAYAPVLTGQVASSSATPGHKPRLPTIKMTAEKAAELMQNALRDLPLGDKLVTDKQKAEALAKLDRAFESTERAIRQGSTSAAARSPVDTSAATAASDSNGNQ